MVVEAKPAIHPQSEGRGRKSVCVWPGGSGKTSGHCFALTRPRSLRRVPEGTAEPSWGSECSGVRGQDPVTQGDRAAGPLVCLLQLTGCVSPVCMLI